MMPARLLPLLVAGLVLAGCGGGAEPATQSASPSMSPSAPTVNGPPGAPTAAACDEVNRLTRQSIDGLSDPAPEHWEALAFSLQGVANSSADPEFRDSLTALATAALTVSEDLTAGVGVGRATVGFLDAVPPVDSLCKKVGVPLI
jgi:hypothetical protein